MASAKDGIRAKEDDNTNSAHQSGMHSWLVNDGYIN